MGPSIFITNTRGASLSARAGWKANRKKVTAIMRYRIFFIICSTGIITLMEATIRKFPFEAAQEVLAAGWDSKFRYLLKKTYCESRGAIDRVFICIPIF